MQRRAVSPKEWTPAVPRPVSSSHRIIMVTLQSSVGPRAVHVVVQSVLGDLRNHNIRRDVGDPYTPEYPVAGAAGRRAIARRTVVRCSLIVVMVGQRGRGPGGRLVVGRVRARWGRDTSGNVAGGAGQGYG